MFPAAFDYHRATSVDDAVATLQQPGGDARVLGGGQNHALDAALRDVRMALRDALEATAARA